MGKSPLVEARSVVAFRGANQILSDSSFSVEEGQIVAIVGENGSGKTTLIETLAGLIPLREGGVYWRGDAGKVVTVRDSAGRRNAPPPMGLTLQKDGICGDETVLERLSDSLEVAGISASEEEICKVLETWGLGHRSGDRVLHLSGGLRRRLSILCGLAPAALREEPTTVLLDEPSEGLDASAKDLLIGWLRALSSRNHGVVFATHDRELINCADRVVSINERKISEEVGESSGTACELPATCISKEPRPILSVVRWSFRTEYRNPVDTIGKATPAIVSLLLAYALVGELDIDSHGSELLAALVLAPAFITAIASPAILGRLSESDCGRWWDAVVGPMARPAYSIGGSSIILPIPVVYLSWFVLAGSVDSETSSEVLWWIWLPALSMLDLAVAATALHIMVGDLSRASAAPAPLLLVVLVWPFLELTDALSTIIDEGMQFSLEIHNPIVTCLIASLISALVWLGAVLIPEY